MIQSADDLMDDASFRIARSIDPDVPQLPGVYAIRLRVGSSLPEPFDTHLRNRSIRLIYIGKATSLRSRMLGNELRGRGHGTFFRSIGAILGYRPQAGSLVAVANKGNYSYEKSDRDALIEWINTNLEVSWSALSLADVPAIELALIMTHTPLLNIAGNPLALSELRALRVESRQIATARSAPAALSRLNVIRPLDSDDIVTPEDLARELGYSGRTIRAFLRSSFPHAKSQRWNLTPDQTMEVRKRFPRRSD